MNNWEKVLQILKIILGLVFLYFFLAYAERFNAMLNLIVGHLK